MFSPYLGTIIIAGVLLLGLVAFLIVRRRGKSTPATVEPVTAGPEGIPPEIIAAISAAVSLCMEEEAPGQPFRIASVVRAGQEGRAPWSEAGLRQNTNPF
ncbi:MAG: OadG family protein [Oscillospiraceae bacterium]